MINGMNIKLYYFLISLVLIFLVIVINLVRIRKLELKYALLWLFTGIALFLIVIEPAIMVYLSKLVGIEVPSNAIFIIAIFFLLLISIALTIALSSNSKRVKLLAQEVAILKNKCEAKNIRDLEEKEID